VAIDRGLARLDHHLAEQDDQEQAEALGEVVRVERLRGVLGPQRRQVMVTAQPVGRRAVLGEHRARLEADRDRPQRVAQRLGHGRREREQGRRAQPGPRDALAQQVAPLPGDGMRAGQTRRATARLSANTVLSPVDAGPIATAATPIGTLAARKSSRWTGSSAPRRL
jgi:hypothetical protein